MGKLLASYEIYHYGIPGMEWGKRRYQYYDGTLTPEGIERYRKGVKKIEEIKERGLFKADTSVFRDAELEAMSKKMAKAASKIQKSLGKSMGELEEDYGKNAELNIRHKRLVDDLVDRFSDTCAGENRSEGMRLAEEYLKTMFSNASEESVKKLIETDENTLRSEHFKNEFVKEINGSPKLKKMFSDPFSPDGLDPKDPSHRTHYREVADLGLKALKRLDRLSGADSDISLDKGWRKWFMFEDQTIGKPLVAHYIVNGNTADEVKDLIDKISNVGYSPEVYNTPVGFSLLEGGGLKKFADICEEVLKEEEKNKKRDFD